MTDFEVWAPNADRVTLRLLSPQEQSGGDPVPTALTALIARTAPTAPSAPTAPTDRPMTSGDGGWFRLSLPDAPPAARYAFLLDDEDEPLPDPRAERLPDGVHGAAQIVDHDAFAWTDRGWTGRTLNGAIFYELHGSQRADGGDRVAVHHGGRPDQAAPALSVNSIDGNRDVCRTRPAHYLLSRFGFTKISNRAERMPGEISTAAIDFEEMP